MINITINKINEQAKDFEKHSPKWNITNQLIDILYAQPQSAEIVLQDLSNEDMSIKALVSKITGQRIANPEDVMQEICKFYGIETPAELPPEMWRSTIAPVPQVPAAVKFSIVDYMV